MTSVTTIGLGQVNWYYIEFTCKGDITSGSDMPDVDIFADVREKLEYSSDPSPIYKRLSNEIRSAVSKRILEEGMSLPSERDLSEILGVSRVTVRKAIADLVAQGVVSKRRGAKTTIAMRMRKPISKLIGFSEALEARGMSAEITWLFKGIRNPNSQEAFALGIQQDDMVVKLRRLRLADGEPIALETTAVPEVFLPTLELENDSLYATLARFGNRPVHGVQRISASVMTKAEAALFERDPGTPVLVFERKCYGPDGRAVEFTTSRYNGNLFDFVSKIDA